MKASSLEFRFRVLLHTVIFGLGFLSPWNRWLHLDPVGSNAHVWGLLAANLATAGIGSISVAFDALLILGIFCALVAAVLRTWGAAYLGRPVVQDTKMHAEAAPGSSFAGIVQAGPFRHLRNPLYLGTIFHTLALALLMSRSGAIFTIVAIAFLQIRLILAEESFLHTKLGEAYASYYRLVPRLWPSIRARIPGASVNPQWPQAFFTEIYMWAVAGSFAFAGWRYNASLLIQCVLIAFGVSLVLQAVIPARQSGA